MYNTLRDIGLHQMWLGFLPVGMVEYQESYYQQIGSRKSSKKWGLDLVQKMLRATHDLWMEKIIFYTSAQRMVLEDSII